MSYRKAFNEAWEKAMYLEANSTPEQKLKRRAASDMLMICQTTYDTRTANKSNKEMWELWESKNKPEENKK